MDFDTIFTAYGGREQFLARLVLAVILFLIGLAGTRGVRFVLRYFYRRVQQRFPEWLSILCQGFAQPILLICRCGFFFLAFLCICLDSAAQIWAGELLAAAFFAFLGWGFWRSSELCRLLLRSAQNKLDLESNKTLTAFFIKIYRAIVAVFTVILVLDVYGVPVSGLLTGAGIAGLAVSLAAQSTLSNLLAGVMLVLEHPFGIGDYVALGGFEGTVEEISFRSTRLRTLDNVLISIENAKVSAEYIQNITSRTSRELCITVGVTYDTPRASIEALCRDFTSMLQAQPGICQDRIYVNLLNFSASSIDIELRTYTTRLNRVDYTALKNEINLKILDIVAQNHCSFAFPSTSVYLENAAPK